MGKTWILQTRAFQDGNPEKFEAILKDLAIDYTWAEVKPFNGGYQFVRPSQKYHRLAPHYEPHEFIPFDKTFFYGTINGFKQVGANPDWCNFDKLKYSYYAKMYGESMLNPTIGRSYSWTKEIYDNKSRVFNYFGRDSIFIRPDDNEKSFDGEVVSYENLDAWYHDTYKYNGQTNLRCWIFPLKVIKQEWRLVVSRGEVISSSQYRLNGSVEIEEGCPYSVEAWAEDVAELYCPEPIFCMDVARLEDGSYKLVEIGSIHTCGLYACELGPIVEAVNANI